MSVKIIVDSCCEVPSAFKPFVKRAPLTIDLDNKSYSDDDNLNMPQYISHMKKMKSFKTACPSIETYTNLLKGDEDVFIITISSNLSGSYQSAVIARDIYLKGDNTGKTIHIIDSKSGSAGQTSILIKLMELCEANPCIKKVIEEIEKFRNEHKIFFVLQSLANLAKAGRVNSIVAKAASVLGIRCIMTRTEDGKIELKQKIVGEKRCIGELAKTISKLYSNFSERTLCISYCENREKVDNFLHELAKFIDLKSFKDVLISHTGGLSSLYADIGGIVIAL